MGRIVGGFGPDAEDEIDHERGEQGAGYRDVYATHCAHFLVPFRIPVARGPGIRRLLAGHRLERAWRCGANGGPLPRTGRARAAGPRRAGSMPADRNLFWAARPARWGQI